MKILSVAQMRALERAAEQEGATMIELMKMAGASAAQLMMDRMGVKADDTVAVLCGKGRNGGDGFISAAYLRQRGVNSSIILMDGEPRSADARAALKAAGEIGVTTWRYWESQRLADQKIRQSKFIIDALYGIGFKDGFLDHMAAFIEKINEEKAGRIMSIDLPSGVQGDTRPRYQRSGKSKPNGFVYDAQAGARAFSRNGLLWGNGRCRYWDSAHVDGGKPLSV